MSAEEKTGYKLTEVGVIPEDWDVKSFAEIGNIKTGPFGTLLKASEYYAVEGVPLVSVRDIGEGTLTFDEHTPLVPILIVRRMPEYVLNDGDIVFGRKGGVDRSAIVQKHQMGCFLGSDGIRIRPSKVYHALFIAYQLQRKEIQAWLLKNATGTTMPSMNQAILRRISLPIPTKAEQEAISEALSDADALIESLEKLTTKKRQIKQGAMQELLTGKKRLPGFSGEWVEKTLGEIATIKTGSSNNQDKNEDGEYPFFVRSNHVERINSYSHDCEAILIPGEGGIGSIFHYINGRFDVHQRVYAITKFVETVSGLFVFYYMVKNFGAHAMQNSVKATVDSLRLPTFQNFEMLIPVTYQEQAAIASVLFDMDAEIDALETKLAKNRQLKQGMMRNLLTGKIRLLKM
jgi:type I restriction enzyme S subunit